MARSRLLAAILLATGLLSVAAPARAADPGWTHPGYGPGNSFYNPNESVINASSIGKLKLRWTARLPVSPTETCTAPSEPVVAGGRVFVTDELGVGAYRQTTGTRLWHYKWAERSNTRTPHLAISGGLLVAGTAECQSASVPRGAIVALSVTTGQPKWGFRTTLPVESLVADRGIVAVAGESTDGASVDAYRLSDGRHRWSLPDYWSAGVSAAGKLLVSGTEEQGVSALAITTGAKLWSRPILYDGLAASPSGDAFYLADGDGGMLTLRSSNGTKLWSRNGTGGAIASDGTRVYRGFSSSIEALNARTGTRLWIRRVGGAGQPVRAGGLLYSATADGLTILTAATGAPAATWRFNAGNDHHVVLAGGTLFQIKGNSIQAFKP